MAVQAEREILRSGDDLRTTGYLNPALNTGERFLLTREGPFARMGELSHFEYSGAILDWSIGGLLRFEFAWKFDHFEPENQQGHRHVGLSEGNLGR